MAVFLIYPFLTAICNSFLSFDAVDKYHIRFTGLNNWFRIVADGMFWKSLGNVIYNQVMFIVFSFVIALVTAMLLSGGGRLDGIYRTIYFLPVITSTTAAMLVFNYLVGASGPIQSLMVKFGILAKPVVWTFSKYAPMPVIALFSTWKWFGIQMIIFIGGIASIDKSVYEAAAIDGSGRLRTALSVTLPLLEPQIVFVLTMNIINGLQMFTEVYMNFDLNGGMYNSASTPVLYLYKSAFQDMDIGYASTIGLFLAVIIFVATTIQGKITEKGEN
jgi:multiple sugar transport system permease protein